MNPSVPKPINVGIRAMEVYFPPYYVDQKKLEEFDNIPSGKYTIGLGQEKMGFCFDNEDIYSICMTALNNLLERNGIRYEQIGRLEVGTETILDKSKSVKSFLMKLFHDSGNTDVEGVDTLNACYGGTAALFNAVSWMESSVWDGRLAVVIAADIAVYATGNARCTGGAGAIAMLIGPNSPLIIESNRRTSHMTHAYDFYKPDLASEYPVVDSQLSIRTYLESLDICYTRFLKKNSDLVTNLDSFSALLFHTPYCKLVQKSVARMSFVELLLIPPDPDDPEVNQFRGIEIEETYFNKDIEKFFMARTENTFKKKTLPSLMIPKNVGNMYTASLYSCLASWIANSTPENLLNQRIGLFSYGSGSAASFFTIKVISSRIEDFDRLCSNLSSLPFKLAQRVEISPTEFSIKMKDRESVYNKASYIPMQNINNMFAGTWYLKEIDEMRRRSYDRKVSGC